MKLKNRDIVKFFDVYQKLREKKLPVKVGYAVKRNVLALQPAAEAYDTTREGIVKKYAKTDESGEYITEENRYIVDDHEKFNEDMQELLDIETDVQIQTITMHDIEKCDDPKYDALTLEEMEELEFMTEE